MGKVTEEKKLRRVSLVMKLNSGQDFGKGVGQIQRETGKGMEAETGMEQGRMRWALRGDDQGEESWDWGAGKDQVETWLYKTLKARFAIVDCGELLRLFRGKWYDENGVLGRFIWQWFSAKIREKIRRRKSRG